MMAEAVIIELVSEENAVVKIDYDSDSVNNNKEAPDLSKHAKV